VASAASACGVVSVPQRYLAGEETALVRHLDRGPLKPTFTPPLPFERGVRRSPTLVQNVETLAHLALVARHGPAWFRATGTSTAPGTMLVTLAGAVARPGVVEVPGGTSVGAALSHADAGSATLASVILGGYFGTWLPATRALALTLDPPALARHGATLGAGVIVALPDTTCAVGELARVMAWLSTESAGQCGPCTHGLSAIADTVGRMRDGTAAADAEEELQRWAGLVRERGACRHPDGAARLLLSALRTLDASLRDHTRHGACDACFGHPVLATPAIESWAA
jgi:NADH:ubiquinone oxidoreductase subunit F (NADH-binding)